MTAPVPSPESRTENSYGQILRASSIVGGAAGVRLLLGMVWAKSAAVLLGTGGVGLLAGFGSIVSLTGTVVGLGIPNSAVRALASADADRDVEALGRALRTLRGLAWITGFLGMVALAVLAGPISSLTFGSGEHAGDIRWLGVAILFGCVSAANMAALQGMRRIGDMARVQIGSAAVATVLAVAAFALLGLRGVVPALVAAAFVTWLASERYARRLPVPPTSLDGPAARQEAGRMIRLGLVFMWTNLLGTLVPYVTIAWIAQTEGLQAVGLYSAAFALSGALVNFVLGAMEADYYPRLAAAARDRDALNRLVNEQTEIALLLALPGLLATLALAPWLLSLFYSTEFLGGVILLQWFVFGCLGRLIAWPLAMLMPALGKSRWFLATETLCSLLHLGLLAVLLSRFGLIGVAIAFASLYVAYTCAVYWLARGLTGLRWRSATLRLGGVCIVSVLVLFLLVQFSAPLVSSGIGIAVTLISGILCVRAIVSRIEHADPLFRRLVRVPGLKALIGLQGEARRDTD